VGKRGRDANIGFDQYGSALGYKFFHTADGGNRFTHKGFRIITAASDSQIGNGG
jgi:hypothetical protein